MSRCAKIELVWADGAGPGEGGKYIFRLRIGELRELQEKVNAGPQTVLQRLATGAWYVDDIRETLRLGLIGGGLAPAKALKLVERYVDAEDRPLIENAPAAQAVILAAVIGVGDDPVGKAEAAKQGPTEKSASPPSTDSAPQ